MGICEVFFVARKPLRAQLYKQYQPKEPVFYTWKAPPRTTTANLHGSSEKHVTKKRVLCESSPVYSRAGPVSITGFSKPFVGRTEKRELYRGFRGHAPSGKFSKIDLSETPYPAFLGSNATNLYVYFVKLLSEFHYSWFPNRSAKIHDSQGFKTKIQDSFLFCKYDSWFMIPLPPPILCLAFLYRWHVLNKISLDWALTLTWGTLSHYYYLD